mmetsp:Transcript_5491/g.9314  ORF Transcript_5491/g.9314 Transcript_5491/m.9314 type:complete len:152 (-) Transcript_5491:22-477(-)
MWNVLVQYHLIFRKQLFLHFRILREPSDVEDAEIPVEEEFSGLSVLEEFMAKSRLKLLEHLGEMVASQVVPRLIQQQKKYQFYQLEIERQKLILLEMVKQFNSYMKLQTQGEPDAPRVPLQAGVLFKKERQLIQHRIIEHLPKDILDSFAE